LLLLAVLPIAFVVGACGAAPTDTPEDEVPPEKWYGLYESFAFVLADVMFDSNSFEWVTVGEAVGIKYDIQYDSRTGYFYFPWKSGANEYTIYFEGQKIYAADWSFTYTVDGYYKKVGSNYVEMTDEDFAAYGYDAEYDVNFYDESGTTTYLDVSAGSMRLVDGAFNAIYGVWIEGNKDLDTEGYWTYPNENTPNKIAFRQALVAKYQALLEVNNFAYTFYENGNVDVRNNKTNVVASKNYTLNSVSNAIEVQFLPLGILKWNERRIVKTNVEDTLLGEIVTTEWIWRKN